MRDSNGATKQQIEAAKAEAIKRQQAPPWPESAPPVPMTLADVAVMVKRFPRHRPKPPMRRLATPAVASTVEPGPPETTASVGQSYGVDLGTAATMKTLHQRWASLRAGHPQLFDGVQPMVSIKEKSAHRPHRVASGHRALRERRDGGAVLRLCPALPAELASRPCSTAAVSPRSERTYLCAEAQPSGLNTRSAEGGNFASFAAGRTGRRASSPPQLGQRPCSTFSAQPRQNVHSNEQITASR